MTGGSRRSFVRSVTAWWLLLTLALWLLDGAQDQSASLAACAASSALLVTFGEIGDGLRRRRKARRDSGR